MKYCFIINPASGKTATKEGLDEKILAACAKKDIQPTIIVSKSAEDAAQQVKNFCAENAGEQLRVYACGGDGTLSIVANAIMQLEDHSNVSLGVVPVGTGNDYVRNFVPSEQFFDIDAQLDATPLDIDLIKCNDVYSVNMINIGFDSQVVCTMARLKASKMVPSKFAYILGLVVTLIKKPGVNLSISADGGEAVKRELLLTTFANGRFCGGGFNSNPNGNLNDGKLNALFVNNISRTKFLSLVGYYKKGEHLSGKFHNILNDEVATSYEMQFDVSTPISVDGEIRFVDKISVCSVKHAIKFLVPAGIEKIDALVKEADTAKEAASV